MDAHFDLLHERLKLTPNQRDEVSRKQNGVSRSLYSEFYEGDYNPKTRLIIGSHGKKTETRHPIGDIDLIFKISKEDLDRYMGYDSNGPSALLQRAKDKLKETYSTTEKVKSWGKVVLVEFGDGQHNVEVLPCYENEDGTFTIPNSENGGSWDNFDPRAEMKMIKDSQAETGVTRELIKFIKRWRTKSSAKIKSYQIEFFCVSFLDASYKKGMTWPEIVEGYFAWLENQSADFDGDALTRVQSALGRAQKARDYELSDDLGSACLEWRKIFGRVFPLHDPELNEVMSLEKKYPTEDEMYIHEKFPVRIDRSISLEIVPMVCRKGFREYQHFKSFLGPAIRYLPKMASLEFKVKSSLGSKANYYWKIRNLSYEARDIGDLRGQIVKDQGRRLKRESTKYNGTHYVECFAIVGGVCVATARRFVPIYEEAT